MNTNEGIFCFRRDCYITFFSSLEGIWKDCIADAYIQFHLSISDLLFLTIQVLVELTEANYH